MNGSLKVLMFCTGFRPVVGGAERQAEKLAKALVAQGVGVTVLTPARVLGFAAEEHDKGVTIRRFPLFDISRSLPGIRGFGPLNLLLLRSQLVRVLNQHIEGACVLHVHLAETLTAFAAQFARGRAVPVICKVGMGGDQTDLTGLARIGTGGPRLVRSMIQSVDRWIATTDTVRVALRELGVSEERIVSIPNGVELRELAGQSLRQGAARRFLYLGRLSTNIDRDLPTLVRAFDRLADDAMNAELSIVGDGDQFGTTKALIARCRNRSRIQLPGQQSPDAWLEWADCMVLPSRREGLSNALLEAMSAGLICIANDIPPNREVLAGGNAGLLTPVESEDDLLQALRRVYTDAQLADRLRRSALERARSTYDIVSVATQYVRLYEQLRR